MVTEKSRFLVLEPAPYQTDRFDPGLFAPTPAGKVQSLGLLILRLRRRSLAEQEER
jgi:hypothetical protein